MLQPVASLPPVSLPPSPVPSLSVALLEPSHWKPAWTARSTLSSPSQSVPMTVACPVSYCSVESCDSHMTRHLHAGLVASTTVQITVTDVNDNRPQFSQETYVATVSEQHTVGASVLMVHTHTHTQSVPLD